jgi:hypothetical protein
MAKIRQEKITEIMHGLRVQIKPIRGLTLKLQDRKNLHQKAAQIGLVSCLGVNMTTSRNQRPHGYLHLFIKASS